MDATAAPLLRVDELRTHFFTVDGVTRAVDGVSFHVDAGETLGIVGESGCGKSVTALSILRLLPARIGRIVGGRVEFEGTNLLELDIAAMRDIRGNRIAMIFQEPMTSLNPVLTIGEQISEAVRIHQGASHAAARARAEEMLRLVKIPDAAKRLDDYPHQFSGGMRQRVMIAMALSCNPKLLIADEPTTALDVTVQAQILRLLLDLRDRRGLSIILVTHDLGVVAQACDSIAVMYAGRLVEAGPKRAVLRAPCHPYTARLIACQPMAATGERLLPSIPGQPPVAGQMPPGCRFHPRCDRAVARCTRERPPLAACADGHVAACPVVTAGWAA
jgi:peptide/nickel transport system ATP-binding protein